MSIIFSVFIGIHSLCRQLLRKLGKLPAKALKDPQVHVLIKKRIRTWRERIFPQLEATGLFVPDNADSLVPAK